MRARIHRALLALAVAVAAASCGNDGTAVEDAVPIPERVIVQAVGTSSVRISWDRVDAPNVAGYEVQRRVDLTGPFTPVASSIPQANGRLTWFDNSVQPDTYYGYRVVAVTSFGSKSATSTVGGTRTPPPPTLVISTLTRAPNDAAADPDGYTVTLLGPRDTVSSPVASNGERRFTPLRAGPYVVVMRGLARNCDFASGDSLKTAAVTDVGVATETRVSFEVSCRDPRRGSVVVRYEQDGDTTDANGVRLSVTGLLTEPDPADTARVFVRNETITSRIATYRYDNLRAGSYEVILDDVAALCSVIGNRRRTLAVRALSLDTVRFNASCTRPIVLDTAGKPLVLEHRWSADAAPTGSRVSLTMALDARARPSLAFSGIAYDVGYSPTVLRFDSSRKAPDIGSLAVNGRTNPGLVLVAGLETEPAGFTGRIEIGKLWFTVIGATGATTRTATQLKQLRTIAPANSEEVTRLRAQEAQFTVGTFTTQNVPPVARANGPYSATTGIATQLSAIGSNDPDGRITAWRWSFGDGSPPVSGETVQHIYQAAGTYTAEVTVTDDKGATSSDQARVTVTNSGTPNQPPVARISAPASANVNSTVTFSGTQSTDSDGVIQSYAWNFGDGTTGTGATVAKAYATPGTYNVTLTVTDNRTATNTASHVITVTTSDPGTTPFTWSGTFGAVDPVANTVDLTLTLDLTPDISDTPVPEALQSFVVDSLKWDPVVLRLDAFNFGPGQQQAVDQSDVARGKVRFTGATLPGQNSGVLVIARLRFKVLGAAGARTTTQTFVGPLIGTPATRSFNYRTRTDVREATLVVAGGTQTGTIAGTVTSPERGALAGVTVTVSSGQTGTTDASGAYTISGVPAGPRSVSLGGLPTGCIAPAAASVTVASASVATANFSVACPTSSGPTGTVTGTITASGGGPISGATVSIAGFNVSTNASGVYTIAAAPVPSGTVNASAPNCTSQSAPYSALASGGTVTVNITLTCQAAGPTYPFTLTWGNITNTGPTGRQVTAIFAINMGAAPGRPDVNGAAADELVALNWTFQFSSSALTYQSRTILAPNLDLIAVGNPSPGLTNLAQTSSQNTTDSGAIQLVRVTYNIVAGFSGTVTPTITINQARAGTFAAPVNVDATVRVGTIPTLTVP